VPESTTEVKSTIAGMVVQRKPVSALFNNASQTSNLAYVQLAVVAPPTKILSAVIKNTMQTLPCSPCAIVVKLAQANGAETSAVWSEKLLADQVRENNPGLARLGISPNIFKWCRNNQPMLNEKGTISSNLWQVIQRRTPTSTRTTEKFWISILSLLDGQPEEDSSDEESVPDDSEKQQHDDDDVDMLSVDDAESVIKVGKNTGVLDDSSDEDDDDEDDDDDSLVDFDVDRDSGK